MNDLFLSGDQEVEEGFDRWAGVTYCGPRLDVEGRLSRFNFEPFLYGRCLAYTTLSEWVACVERLTEWFHTRIAPIIKKAQSEGACDSNLLFYEQEAVEKGRTNWRAIGYGRQVFAHDFVCHSMSQAADLRPGLERAAKLLCAALRSMSDEAVRARILSATIHLDKSKGAPFFQAGSNVEAGAALALLPRQLRSFKQTQDVLERLSGGVKLRLVMLKRIQGSRKSSQLKKLVAGKLVAQGSGLVCKVRTVKAPPFVLNATVAWFFSLVKDLMMIAWPERHPLAPKDAAQTMQRYAYSFSSDMSTFDDTIAEESLQLIGEIVFRRLLDDLHARGLVETWMHAFILEYDQAMIRGEIICPARTTAETACILKMEGGVKSGERATTVKDILVAWARTTLLLDRLSKDTADSFINWGDDIVILTNDRTLQDRWASCKAQRHVFSEKIAPGAVFLMKIGGSAHGFMMRYAFRRLNMELHEEPSDVLQAALTLRASLDSLTSPTMVLKPHPAAGEYLTMVSSCIPRLSTACRIASAFSFSRIAELYIQSRRSLLEKREFLLGDLREANMRGLISDDEYDDELSDYGHSHASSIVSNRLAPGRLIPVVASERWIRETASCIPRSVVERCCKR